MIIVVTNVLVDRTGQKTGKGEWKWGWDAAGECYLRYAKKRIIFNIFVFQLASTKIASENRIPAFLVLMV